MSTAVIPAPKKFVEKTDVVNNLSSTRTDKPLSANMGKALSEAIAQSTAKTSFNISLPDGYGWTYFKGYMIANVYVYFAGRIDLASPSTEKTINLGTIIPQACRPSETVTFAAFNNTTDNAIDGRILKDGTFVFYRPETENLSSICFSVMYAL